MKGNLKFIEDLINHGANICLQDNSGASTLHMTAYRGDYRCAELLLKAKKPLLSQGNQYFISLQNSNKLTAMDVAHNIACNKSAKDEGEVYRVIDLYRLLESVSQEEGPCIKL